ncbi:hypothetical protein F5Y03DRAFT_403570 [Xylaria venustula]|nr:hypothetical protein F5Y03DRAFT_403570 [Xylaria venustula]
MCDFKAVGLRKPQEESLGGLHVFQIHRLGWFVYALAKKYNIPGLKEAAKEAYTSTIEADRGLRDVMVTTFHEHPELLDQEETPTLKVLCAFLFVAKKRMVSEGLSHFVTISQISRGGKSFAGAASTM